MTNKDIIRDKNFKHAYINKYILKNFNDCKPCFIQRCTNSNIYTNPGYYINFDSNLKNKNLYNKCFKTAKQAAVAFFRSEYKFFDLIKI